MKSKNVILKILGLIILTVLLAPTDALAHSSVVKRKKCRWWKKNKVEVSIEKKSPVYVSGYWYAYSCYSWSCNCYVTCWAYQPGYYTYTNWYKVRHQKDKGCSNASASQSYSYFGNRNASVSASVTSSSASVSSSSNHWTLRCGEGDNESPECEGEEGATSGHIDANTEFGENGIDLFGINGELSVANNTQFAGVFRMRGFESFSAEGMSEEEQDAQDNIDMEEHSFFNLEIRVINGKLSVVSDADQELIANFVDGLEIQEEGDFFNVNFNNLNQFIPVPAEVDPDNVSLELFMDTYYDTAEVDNCIEESIPAPEEGENDNSPAQKDGDTELNRLQDNSFETAALIAPNPVTDQLNLELPVKFQDEPIWIRILDAQGSVLFEERRSSVEKLNLNAAFLPDGIYFLQIQGKEKKSISQRFVKMN